MVVSWETSASAADIGKAQEGVKQQAGNSNGNNRHQALGTQLRQRYAGQAWQ
jgi:hypothetical protein